MNQLERWMDSLNERALKQALRFLLESPESQILVTQLYMRKLIEEHHRMYPPDFGGMYF